MMKYILLIIISIFSFQIFAESPLYISQLPSTNQQIVFSTSAIEKFLTPMGFVLRVDTLNLTDVTPITEYGSLTSPINFVARKVDFEIVEKVSGKVKAGQIYLIIASNKASEKFTFNSTAKKYKTIEWRDSEESFVMLLSRGENEDSLDIEISPHDFHLRD